MTALRILTVEDDAAIRRGIVDALTFAGYDIIEAANGIDGCRAAVSREYDLLLLDMVLPGKSGLDILREVRTRGRRCRSLFSARAVKSETGSPG